MKRTLAMLLTFGMVGSLMFMGFAGTAAAQEVDVDLGGDGGDGGDAVNVAEVNQQTNNAQEANAEATATSGADDKKNDDKKNDHYKKDHKDNNADSSTAVAAVYPTQYVSQTNDAEVNQDARGGDGGDGGAVDISVDLGDNGGAPPTPVNA